MKLLRQLSTVSAMKNNQYILGVETNSTYIGLVVEKSIFVQIQPYNLFRGSLEFQQNRKRFHSNESSPDPWPSGSISHSKLIKQVSSRLVIFIGHFIGLRSSSFVQ